VLVLGLTMGLGSCTAVLGLDGYGDVAGEMCSLLDRCYPASETDGCLGDLQKNLDGATSDVRVQWLDTFTSFGCLESCSAGRHCLDIPPLCTVAGACERRQDCCGFLEGNATCPVKTKTCCATRGSTCSVDSDCCDGRGACLQGVCGGIACLPSTSDCTTDGQCCTKICKRGSCADTICEDDKAACAEDQDCCSHFCDPTSRLCAEPPKCGAIDAPCALDTDCCADTSCLILSGSLTGTCQASTCSFADIDCSADKQCCSGRCDLHSFSCAAACLHEASACASQADCCEGTCTGGVCTGTCSTTSCNVPTDCCSKTCVDHICGAACEPTSNHTPCTVGGPLGITVENTGCVDVVCAADPYCCCGAWDEPCALAAAALPNSCPALCK
jgi:hypothetical protein